MPDVPESFLKTVVFLGYREDAGVEVAGTAFLLSSPPEPYDHTAVPPGRVPGDYASDESRLTWLVTSKHVVSNLKRKTVDGRVVVLVNARGGGRVTPHPELDVAAFAQVPDTPTGLLVDLALARCHPDAEWDLVSVPIEACASSSRMRHAGIRAGMDAFCPGFFWGQEGVGRNTPVMRVGAIAAPADHSEPVTLGGTGAQVVAHLVGLTATAGMSGSPVFVAMPPVRVGRDDTKSYTYMRVGAGGEFFLLGVLLAHFSERGDGSSGASNMLNTNLAVVQHADALSEAIADATERLS